jgi:hypothetical protein
MAKITVTRTEKEDKKNSPEQDALVSEKLEEIRREVWWVSTFLVKIPLILGGLFLIFFIYTYFENQSILETDRLESQGGSTPADSPQ